MRKARSSRAFLRNGALDQFDREVIVHVSGVITLSLSLLPLLRFYLVKRCTAFMFRKRSTYFN